MLFIKLDLPSEPGMVSMKLSMWVRWIFNVKTVIAVAKDTIAIFTP
jgi:hypothetical protein